MPIDPNSLPQDANALRKIVLDLAERLDRAFAEQQIREPVARAAGGAAQPQKRAVVERAVGIVRSGLAARNPEDESDADEDDYDFGNDAQGGQKPDETPNRKRGGRQPLARHLTRERIVHDLAEWEKHCA